MKRTNARTVAGPRRAKNQRREPMRPATIAHSNDAPPPPPMTIYPVKLSWGNPVGNRISAIGAAARRRPNLVVLMIDGIHFGGQVLVVALGIAESGEKHVF